VRTVWNKLEFGERKMEKNTPVRKPHTSTADLLTWSENHAADSPAAGSAASAARSSARSQQVYTNYDEVFLFPDF